MNARWNEPQLGLKHRLATYGLLTILSVWFLARVSMCIYCRFVSGSVVIMTLVGAAFLCFLVELVTHRPADAGGRRTNVWWSLLLGSFAALCTVVFILTHECVHDRVIPAEPPDIGVDF